MTGSKKKKAKRKAKQPAQPAHRGIEYTPGQEIGKHGITWIDEGERYVSPKGKAYRQGHFRCPCGNDFVAPIHAVKSGRKKSCGCVVNRNQALSIEGNSFAEKFKTDQEKIDLLNAWMIHRASGYSHRSFSFCDEKTFERLVVENPHIFTEEKLHIAESEHAFFWEKEFIKGMKGETRNFQASMGIFAMKAKFNWSDRPQENEGDDGEAEPMTITFEVKPARGEIEVTNAGAKS